MIPRSTAAPAFARRAGAPSRSGGAAPPLTLHAGTRLRQAFTKAASPRSVRRALRALAPLAALVTTLSLSSAAAAQLQDLTTPRVPVLGRSLSGTDDTTALTQNPANLGFLPGAELRWGGLLRTGSSPDFQHALSFATPLPFGLAAGLRVDFVDVRRVDRGISQPEDEGIQYLTWGLAASPDDTLSIGFSFQRAAVTNAPSSATFALTARPAPALSFSVVGHHLIGTQSALLNAPNVNAGVALLPFGSRGFELGLEALYFPDGTDVSQRATLGIGLGRSAKLFGALALIDGDFSYGTLGLSLYPASPGGSTELTVGAFGRGVIPSHEDAFAEVAVRGFREREGSGLARYGVRLRVESTADARGHVRLLRQLWRLADERQVDAVLLELRTSPAASFAHAQELRDALFHLRARGKRVLCHLEDNGGLALYVCAAASKTLINPAGGVRFAGLKTQSMYFAGLLEKLGIRADFVRIGAHKSAPERLTRTGGTDVAKADRKDLLQQLERQLVEGLASGRRQTPEAVRRGIAAGPHIASEALDVGFVDGVAFDDELGAQVRALTGRDTLLVSSDAFSAVRPRTFQGGRSIAVVYVDGDMVDGRSASIPMLGMRLVGSYTVAEALKQAREDKHIAGVVLRVETPGGSAMAADVIWREAQLTAQAKPFVVSMGSYAASAGYYISAPAERIFANPASITGSIGVFYGKADVAGLLQKIGVSVETAKTAPRADAESLFRPFSPEEREELNRKVGQFYDTFLSRVSAGRKLTKRHVHEVAQGRVWTGEQAEARRLVDELGGLRQAIAYVSKRAQISEQAPLVELPVVKTSLLGQLLGVEGLSADTHLSLPPQLRTLIQALGPFLVYESDKPLMRLEQAPIRP